MQAKLTIKVRRAVGYALAVTTWLFLATSVVLAQAGEAVLAGFPLEEVAIAVATALAPGIVWLVKRIPYGRVPKFLLPIMSSIFGYALSQVAAWMVTVDLDWWLSAILGLATIGLREIIDQLGKMQQQPDIPAS